MSITVAKFGGTSVGSASAMQAAAKIICANPETRLVVLSAVSGTTNALVTLLRLAQEDREQECLRLIEEMGQNHRAILAELDLDTKLPRLVDAWITETHDITAKILVQNQGQKSANSDLLLSQGERIASAIFAELLKSLGKQVSLIDAREVIRTDNNFGRAEPDTAQIRRLAIEKLLPIFANQEAICVTQGFVGSTSEGETTTLGRGGSDYSAALLAEAVGADDLQIWTDVAGIRTIDPRLDSEARPIKKITFAEAAELANFGAKILHPSTLEPARRADIRVFVGSTQKPELGGTTIVNKLKASPAIRAIAIRRHQTLITVTSPRMLNTHGFLAKMFAILAEHRIPVDLVTTSEVSVALTIDSDSLSSEGKQIKDYSQLLLDLHHLGEVRIESGLALIALIGNHLQSTPGVSARTFSAIGSANVRLICQGASSHNLCFLVHAKDAESAAKALHQSFIVEKETCPSFRPVDPAAETEIIPYEVQ